jgi:hypothetical protein
MYRTLFPALAVPVVAALVALAPAAARQPGKAVVLFDGKDLSGWKFKGDAEKAKAKSKWMVGHAGIDEKEPNKLAVSPTGSGAAQLVNSQSGGVDIYTEEKFGDGTLELEFMVPKGSNSGVYVLGEYEVQVLDSFGRAKVGPGDVGGLYGAAAPRMNAAKKPGEWQKFVIEYQAPRFEGGKKVSNMKFQKVVLNDQVIHENVEMKGPTPSGVTGKEAPTGPLMFQGDHGAVAFRNIKFTPRAAK